MIRPVVLFAFASLANFAASGAATPPPPPAAHTWIKMSWECPEQQRSFIEIERLAQGDAGYRNKIVGLMISGREIDPDTVAGLKEFEASRNYLRIAGGYCESGGERIGLEELASGPQKIENGWRGFYVPYASQP